ncbi:MAG: hypothetical protein U1C73_08070, partial [Dietzia sp.]|nr:hypothetical protein [Dietzia sp.]
GEGGVHVCGDALVHQDDQVLGAVGRYARAAHDAGEIANNGLESSAQQFYSYGSSFIHGYKWMTDYSRGGTVFPMIADALAVTLNMAECAACLFEAASRAPDGARPEESHLPERFEPTVAAWSAELFSS